MRPGYRNFHACGAVCPATGEDFTLVLEGVDTPTMGLYLREMAGQLGGRECILVMDRAGWHVSKGLEVPLGIEIVLLPPYSPELNPVERLWQWLKRHTIREAAPEPGVRGGRGGGQPEVPRSWLPQEPVQVLIFVT